MISRSTPRCARCESARVTSGSTRNRLRKINRISVVLLREVVPMRLSTRMRGIEVSSGSSGSSAARKSSESSIRPVALMILVVYGSGCTGKGSLPVFCWEREEICHGLGLTLRNPLGSPSQGTGRGDVHGGRGHGGLCRFVITGPFVTRDTGLGDQPDPSLWLHQCRPMNQGGEPQDGNF